MREYSMSRKGIIQIAFLPLLLAGFLSVILIGAFGFVTDWVSSGLSKLVMIGVAILIAYIVYRRIDKKPVDAVTIGLLIGAVILALLVLGGNNILGLGAMVT